MLLYNSLGMNYIMFVCWRTDKLLGAVYGDYNSRPTKVISFGAFFQSVTTKYMWVYVTKRLDFSFFIQKLVTTKHYWQNLYSGNPTLLGLFAGLDVLGQLIFYLFPILITITSSQL